VGNKIDLEEDRKVSAEEARNLAEQHKMKYFETSARLNKNIDELMMHLMEKVYQKMFQESTGDGEGARGKSVVINKKDHKKSEGGQKKNGGGGCCK
jgi:50S ribosomal subunit-associated GTPase HflX